MIRTYKGREVNPEKPVKVYRNLNNKLLSVVQDNVVVGHTEEIFLQEVSFSVQKAGQKRCRETKQKSIHAFAKGMINPQAPAYADHNRVSYNPYVNDGFTNAVGEEIKFISGLYLNADGLMLHA